MSKINWGLTKNFKAKEWPGRVTRKMDANLFHELFKLRSNVPSWCGMTPSPIIEAHVRQEGTSRHSTENGMRLSDATDLFVSWKALWPIFKMAQQLSFGGIGLYLDTQLGGKEMPMIHLDMRDNRLVWVRYNGVYYYYDNDPIEFFRVLSAYGKRG